METLLSRNVFGGNVKHDLDITLHFPANRADDNWYNNSMNRLLVIDDDIELCELVTEYLAPEGFQVKSVHDGLAGLEHAVSGDHDFVVLDVMLPSLGGFEILRRIRASSSIPVLMLTARGSEIDRILGLEIGADDYLPKPFNPRELVARIRAVQRRSKTPIEAPARNLLTIDDVAMDLDTRSVKRDGLSIELTGVEYNVLETLLRHAGQIVTREHLVKMALGRRLLPYDRSVDMHVSNLRRKLGHTIGTTERIKTVRGVGYFYAHVRGGNS
jgi:two-component system, OmpR family, response regulator CpxR